MTTEQTAQQLELAAQILRTGHPFEVRHDASDRWHASLGVNPAQAVLQNWCLRPVLATPPDGRPLNNPDNLTAEQVGVGYRLTVEGELVPGAGAEWWCRYSSAWLTSTGAYLPQRNTVRLPLSVPWPPTPVDPYAELKKAHAAGKVIQCKLRMGSGWTDYTGDFSNADSRHEFRIKPDAPPFQPSDQAQLPPPPPGMSWHRMDGWKKGDLPSGYRPHVEGEADAVGDELRTPGIWKAINFACNLGSTEINNHRRTTRPLVFERAGKTWTWHRPGDPMPCDGERRVYILCKDVIDRENHVSPHDCRWSEKNSADIIGWRYAEPQMKTVSLGPEDVRCGDEIMDEYQLRRCVFTVGNDGVSLGGEGFIAYEHLTGRKIRRRDSNEFVPCSKTIPA